LSTSDERLFDLALVELPFLRVQLEELRAESLPDYPPSTLLLLFVLVPAFERELANDPTSSAAGSIARFFEIMDRDDDFEMDVGATLIPRLATLSSSVPEILPHLGPRLRRELDGGDGPASEA
jgi:hypothetical protein